MQKKKDKWKMQKKALKIIKLGLADAVASDSHGIAERMPRLDAANEALTKFFDEDIADRLLRRSPSRILGIKY